MKRDLPRDARTGHVRLTALQWTVLRWVSQLGGLQRQPHRGWTMLGGRPRFEIMERFVVPDALEASGWRVADDQVKALRSYGLVCWDKGRIVVTVHGQLVLDGKT